MNSTIHNNLENIRSENRELQNKALLYLLEATEKPVDWAYEAWDELVRDLDTGTTTSGQLLPRFLQPGEELPGKQDAQGF